MTESASAPTRAVRRGSGAHGRKVSKRRGRWKINWFSLVIAVIALAGMSIYMYPSTAAWWSQWNQSRIIRDFSQQVASDTNPGNVTRLANAYEYNRLLSTGVITVDGDARKPTTETVVDGDLDYWSLLDMPGGAMARLKIDAINVDLPVYHGTSDEVLLKGVGHLQGTSLPVGGTDTHSVLSAHRGLASATMFDNLDKLKIGDTFVIEVAGEVLTYRVYETQVVLPDETQKILPQAGKDIVTLVTCTPLGINTHRILVTGERITPTPIKDVDAAGAVPNIPGFPWWAVILPSGVILAGIYVWRSGYPARPKSGVSVSAGSAGAGGGDTASAGAATGGGAGADGEAGADSGVTS